MSVIREALRVVGQVLRFALAERRIGLWLMLVVGALLVLLAVATSVAAPVLIYPLV